ncbi:hypothetical protein CJF31_00003232 [Rutstroemia sp. NJR-2017a BVV2]|nr:hypothetical protein CJF31_00002024 [Rutstroemia sp. NJR-2017a BVV2]PQE18576.1 hypothetical protein CJF31_00003232 [Rutstroemia sp. NJR-2017a BVV2]
MAETITAASLAIVCQVYLSPIPEPSTLKIVSTYFSGNLVLFLYLLRGGLGIFQSTTKLTYLNVVFLLTATIFTLIRRLYFSPLSHIPGPSRFALTKLFLANEYFQGRASLTTRALHQEYQTDVVRIGPNEVSVVNVDAISKLYSGKYPRGTFYEMVQEIMRNILREMAFANSSFKEYNHRTEHHVDKMMTVLQRAGGKEIDFSEAAGNLVFDIMTDLGFSIHTGRQDGKGDDTYMSFIHKYMSFIGVVGSLRNFAQLLVLLPETEDVRIFREKGEAMLTQRQNFTSRQKDIFSHLLAEDNESGTKFTQKELDSNAQLVIVAGTDTTVSVVIQTVKKLANLPEIYRKLQNEIDDLYTRGQSITIESVRNLEYLNGVVNEALRLYTPTPSGTYATTYPQGLVVDGVHIPGNVQVNIPFLALMRDERYFVQGEDFIPERWTSERPDMLKDKRAFIPFGYGVHGCVGKTLALHELRLVLSLIAHNFNLRIGPSHDEDLYNSQWRDHAVLQVGKLWMSFEPRSTSRDG